MPHSWEPFDAYRSNNPISLALDGARAAPGQLARLDQLIRDGKLYISLRDAIDLALENNLDLAIARYNLPIADTDFLRTKAGGIFRGVNTGVVQGTPGGGVGGFGTGAPGAGAGGTTGGAGGPARAHQDSCSLRWASERTVPSYRSVISGTMRNRALEAAAGQPSDLRCSRTCS